MDYLFYSIFLPYVPFMLTRLFNWMLFILNKGQLLLSYLQRLQQNYKTMTKFSHSRLCVQWHFSYCLFSNTYASQLHGSTSNLLVKSGWSLQNSATAKSDTTSSHNMLAGGLCGFPPLQSTRVRYYSTCWPFNKSNSQKECYTYTNI